MSKVIDLISRILFYALYGWRLRALEKGMKKPGLVAYSSVRRLKRLRAKRIEWFTRGCLPCSKCGAAPIALIQPRPHGNVYEIGCSRCLNRKSFGMRRQIAVTAWNNGLFHR